MIKKYTKSLRPSNNFKIDIFDIKDFNKYQILSNIFKFNTIPYSLIYDDVILVHNGSKKLLENTIKEYIDSKNNIGFLYIKNNIFNLVWINTDFEITIYGKKNPELFNYLDLLLNPKSINYFILKNSSEDYLLILLILKILEYNDSSIIDCLNTEFLNLQNILLNSLQKNFNYLLNI